jgi:carbamoyltransferase
MTGRTPTKSAVLGLCSYTHDSAAALIVDGELVGFAEEERLVGDKHTKAYPAHAVTWLLAKAGIAPEQITAVGYNFQAHRYLGALAQVPGQLVRPATRSRAVPRARSFIRVARRTRVRLHELSARFSLARVTAVQHHRAHGLYAFVSSGYEDAAVLVADSLGEVQTTTIGHARRTVSGGCEYRIVEAIDDPASLGYAYGAVTEHLGWRRGDEEGTVMALAALGDPARFRELFTRAIPLTDTGFALDPELLALRVLSSRYGRIGDTFIAATCPPRRPDEPVEQVHRDLAAALQERTERVMLHLAQRARRHTGSDLLCVGGGVAANCVAIGKIVDAGLFDEVHVPPVPGDSGTAIGAAIALHLAGFGTLPAAVTDRCYLGPAYPDLTLSTEPRRGLAAHRPADPARFLAHQLADGRIVGLFQGRLEAGPRALGNRSILACPLLPDVVERLNATVKFREPFRPFAPLVLANAASDYFTLPQPAQYMSIASGVTQLTRDKIPAVVHANDTARVQTLTPEQNPFLAEVLTEFAALTGVPVLINTSLNVKGKPICGTPEMALDCLAGSGLDALMMEGWWITK